MCVLEARPKSDIDILMNNLKENCTPVPIFDMDLDDCHTYLRARRVLIARKIETYSQTMQFIPPCSS